jgi:hypothetical protein
LRAEDFQSWDRFRPGLSNRFGASAKVPPSDNTLAVMPVSAISVVAGARNHLHANQSIAFRLEIQAESKPFRPRSVPAIVGASQ